ncbi:uncharacterized protein LOC132256021 [Phlebotomus argentipes]|uniref:uncharacterized protein LOC132256021 n=1 Tax=Phlebotomus argentipes TaxID=94469 RepID=UPI0028936F13|nr:uncharacterized protein LOC132256021 [Phlebotomus argentipes]
MELLLLIVTALIFPPPLQVRAEDCGQDELVQCARPLQVLSATSELSFVSTKEELDKLCPDLHFGLHCIRSYTRRCMSIYQRDHFNKLYHGTSQVIHELCEEGPNQEDFLRHAPCMRLVKRQYETCSTTYQATMSRIGQIVPEPSETSATPDDHNLTRAHSYEMERIKTVCCAFKDYIDCSEQVVRLACGEETANYTRRFLDKMSSSLMTMHCEDYGPESNKCANSDTFNRSTSFTLSALISLLCAIVIFYY